MTVVAVIGHSYGGNRARLFAHEIRQKYKITLDLLVTVDPINWDISSKIGCLADGVVQLVFFGATLTGACEQSGLTYPSRAKNELSFRQTLGSLGLGVLVPVKGYSLAGTSPIVIQNDYHDAIDDDPLVHAKIIDSLLSLVGP